MVVKKNRFNTHKAKILFLKNIYKKKELGLGITIIMNADSSKISLFIKFIWKHNDRLALLPCRIYDLQLFIILH